MSGKPDSKFRDPAEMAREGIHSARMGDYESGYSLLGDVCDRYRSSGGKIPAPVVSYYGLCMALQEGRYREAAQFCQAAIDTEPFKADYYANLANVCAAGKIRRKAIIAIQRGLAIDPENERLLRLQSRLGMRQPPVISFLDRSNPVNIFLGRLRHSASRKRADES